ncbi:phage tail protein [Pararhodospirillum photometricum]|uniref:phage tail protein n=1 Tax=Pararhodospirillum photometricum TaxID=1084 RepID=UPI0009DA2B95|nr:tail fiber protein [Pararhodospirillum photometricum]
MDAFTGEIRAFAFSFAPVDWAFCRGDMMNVSQNQVLFMLIGNRYGGDGRTTFALPNLAGRVAIGFGNAAEPGNSTSYSLGEDLGSETVSLTTAQTPAHTHPVVAKNTTANVSIPGSNIRLANGASGRTGITKIYAPPSTPTAIMSGVTVGTACGPNNTGAAHENRQPYLPMNYCISLYGIWPSRS